MNRKIYIVEECGCCCGEDSSNKFIKAFFSKDKANDLKADLEEIEHKIDEEEDKCMKCRFDSYSYYVKNEKTFNRRAKQFCENANFVPMDDGYGELCLECQSKPPERWDHYYYYIRETELSDD